MRRVRGPGGGDRRLDRPEVQQRDSWKICDARVDVGLQGEIQQHQGAGGIKIVRADDRR